MTNRYIVVLTHPLLTNEIFEFASGYGDSVPEKTNLINSLEIYFNAGFSCVVYEKTDMKLG